MFKFLPGIILIQIVTCGLMLTAFNWSHDIQLIIVIGVIALISAILAAFWFSSIARNLFNDEQTYMMQRHVKDRESILKQAEQEKSSIAKEKSELQNQHARERERILLDAERDKANTIAESYQKIEKETRKAYSKANFKVGLAFATAAGAGGVMIFSQLITVGVMLVVASGSGLSGYLLRAKHERLSRKKQLADNQRNLITDQSENFTAQKLLQKEK
jgi:hypothetical protein